MTTVLYTAMTPDLMPVLELMCSVQVEEEIVLSTVMTHTHVYKQTQHALRETVLRTVKTTTRVRRHF